jgi:hypothetical protein
MFYLSVDSCGAHDLNHDFPVIALTLKLHDAFSCFKNFFLDSLKI